MRAIISILILSLIVACTNLLKRADYIAWVTSYNNGLHVKERSGGFVFDVQYNPVDFMWLQRASDPNDNESYIKTREELDGLQYVTLSIVTGEGGDIVKYGTTSLMDFEQRQYYFTYQFQHDIVLEENGQMLPCVLFHYEKPVDLRPVRTFLLGFERPVESSKEAKLIVSSDYLSSLVVRIKILKDNIPALKV